MRDDAAFFSYDEITEVEHLFTRGSLTAAQYDAALTYGVRYKQAQKGKTDLADEYGTLSFLESALIDRVVGQADTIGNFISAYDIPDYDYETGLGALRAGLNKLAELYEVG